MKHKPEDIRQFVVDCRSQERRQRQFSATEEKLWDLAEFSPFEQTRIITTNEQVLADPYLMRVYLSPQREALEATLRELGVSPFAARLIQKMPRPYLHYFFRGDDDRAFHNHPWTRSVSFILIGGYIEHIWNFELGRSFSRLLKPGSINHLERDTYHRVELLPGKKCWTLFVSMDRVQASDGTDWEFYDPEDGTFIPWGMWTSADAKRRDFRSHGKMAHFTDFLQTGRVSSSVPNTSNPPSSVPDLGADPDASHGGYNWSGLRR